MLPFPGPAFIAALAYVMAMLIQSPSAKLGIVTALIIGLNVYLLVSA